MYSFHYLELRFRENPQFRTIKKNWKTEGGVKSVGCDGVEASEPRSNSIPHKEGAPGCAEHFSFVRWMDTLRSIPRWCW